MNITYLPGRKKKHVPFEGGWQDDVPFSKTVG